MPRWWLALLFILASWGCSNSLTPEEQRLKEVLVREEAMLNSFAQALEKTHTSSQLKEAIINFGSELKAFNPELSTLEESLPHGLKQAIPPASLRPVWDSLKLAKARIQKALSDKRHLFNSEVKQALAELELLGPSLGF